MISFKKVKRLSPQLYPEVILCIVAILALACVSVFDHPKTIKATNTHHVVATTKKQSSSVKKPTTVTRPVIPVPVATTSPAASPTITKAPVKVTSAHVTTGQTATPVVTPSPTSSVSGLTPATTTTPTAPSGSGGSGSTSSTAPVTTAYISLNWSGYLATTGTYTTISGNWTTPSVSSSVVSSADSSWIGIGGVTGGDLIQVGTEDSVSASGQVTEAAFYEMLPRAADTIASITINPGDSITASISETGADDWTISITDLTSNQDYTRTVYYDSSESSAEWIEEDPSYTNDTLVPLDNFGSVSFTNGQATTSGISSNILSNEAEPVTMVNSSDQTIALPSSLTGGSDFTVTEEN